MIKIFLSSMFLCVSLFTTAQVGINTDTPQALLHVVGNARFNGNLYLEKPGNFSTIRGSKLLVNTAEDKILQYDVETSGYGPINYAQIAFTNASTEGIADYDTKISTSEYLVNIQGYYFTGPNGTTDIMPHSNTDTNTIPGFQMYAYKNGDTKTWHVKGFFNNASFRSPSAEGYRDVPVNLYMNLIIFRNGFLSKTQADITVDMQQAETISVPLPEGF